MLTAAINFLALAGPASTLLIYGHAVPQEQAGTLLAVAVIMAGLYALGAAFDVARQRLLARCSHRVDRRLAAMAVKRTGSIEERDLNAIRAFLGSQLPPALCDAPCVPLYLLALALLHPLLCAMAVAGAVSIAGSVLAIDRHCRRGLAAKRRRALRTPPLSAAKRSAGHLGLATDARRRHEQEATAHKIMLTAAVLRALRPGLQSMMLGLGGYLAMTGACHAASVVAAAIILPRLIGPIESILVQWPILAAAHASAQRLATWPRGCNRESPATRARGTPGGVKIVLRRSGSYARNATRGGVRSASSDLRPTAQ